MKKIILFIVVMASFLCDGVTQTSDGGQIKFTGCRRLNDLGSRYEEYEYTAFPGDPLPKIKNTELGYDMCMAWFGPVNFYTWQKSFDKGLTWITLVESGANLFDYSPFPETKETWYRRIFTTGNSSSPCKDGISNIVKLFIDSVPWINGGKIATSTTNYSLGTPLLFTNLESAIPLFPYNSPGTNIMYKWYMNNVEIPGATSSTLTYTGTLNANTTFFRCAFNGSCNSFSISNKILINVTGVPTLTGGSISSTVNSICNTTTSFLVNGTSPAVGANTPIVYTWEKQLGTNWQTTTFTSTNNGYSATLTGNGVFRRKATDNLGGIAYSNEITVALFTSNALNGGVISPNSQNIAPGDIPLLLNNSSSASGGSSSLPLLYQWQQSETRSGSFTDISGATNASYQPFALTTSTYFRRKVYQANCTNVAFSNTASVLVRFYSQNWGGFIRIETRWGHTSRDGSITVASGVPFTIDQIKNRITPLDCNNSLINSGLGLFWQYSYDSTNWTFANNGLDLLSIPTITQTAFFRRVTWPWDPGICDDVPVYSNIVKINVVPILGKQFYSSPTNQCNTNDSVSLFEGSNPDYRIDGEFRPESSNTPITFIWEKKINGVWTPVPFSFTIVNGYQRRTKLLGIGLYRRKTVDGIGQIAYSNEINVGLVSVNTTITPVLQNLTSGQLPTGLSVTASISGYTTQASNYTYLWQSTTDTISGSWSNINAATSANYTPQSNTTAFYRCLVTNTNFCTNASDYTKIASVIYASTALTGGSITNPTLNINVGTNVGTINSSSAASGGTSPLTYSWQRNTNNNWVVIANASNATYDVGVLNQTTSFRRKVTDANNDSAFSNTLTFNVQHSTLKAGLVAQSVTVCPNTDTAINEIVAACGGYNALTYSWEYNSGSGWVIITNSNTPNLRITNITTTTKYRRKVTDGLGNFAYCNEVEIRVYEPIYGGTLNPTTQTICGTGSTPPEEINLVQTNHNTNGTVGYQWQKSTSANGVFTDVDGAVQPIYRPKISTQMLYYRLKVTSTTCNMVGYSTVSVVNVNMGCRTIGTSKPPAEK